VPTQSERLVGSIIKYDASMHSHSAQADLVVKLRSKGETKYVRLSLLPQFRIRRSACKSLSSYCRKRCSRTALSFGLSMSMLRTIVKKKVPACAWQAIRSRAKRFGGKLSPSYQSRGTRGRTFPSLSLCFVRSLRVGPREPATCAAPPCKRTHREHHHLYHSDREYSGSSARVRPFSRFENGPPDRRVGHFNVEDVTPGCLLTSTEITGGAPLLGARSAAPLLRRCLLVYLLGGQMLATRPVSVSTIA